MISAAGTDAEPHDPRMSWELPAPGGMPVIARLDELVVRVLAPNPSPMTLDGTNTYIVCGPGDGEAAVVDPGPDLDDHLQRVRDELAELGAQCRWIVLTHSHRDHAEAAPAWGDLLGARIAARPGVLALGTTSLRIIATPGHTGDHVAIRLENAAVLSGDCVLGRGTSVIAHPEGELLAYVDSLRRLADVGPAALYPGHGPELREDPVAVIDYYLQHRAFRERQITALLATTAGGMSVDDIVRTLYAEASRHVWPAAELSTRAALEKLRTEGLVRATPDASTFTLVR